MKFNFDWLKSKDRLELEQLRKEKIQREVLGEKKEEWTNKIAAATPSSFDKKTYAYRSVRLLGDLVLVVLNDGSTLSSPNGGADLFGKIRDCNREEEILVLFSQKSGTFARDEDKGNIKLVQDNFWVFDNNKDFEVRDANVYLKGLGMALPPVIVGAFIELIDKLRADSWEDKHVEMKEEYQALKMFTLKLALNPIQSSREDCLTFIRNNDIRITATGNLVAYRGIVSTGKKDKALSKFVSTEYFKVKKWKKSPSSYEVWFDGEKYVKAKDGFINGQLATGRSEGNLQELYDNLGDLEENTYTDAHTRKMKIKIGEVYSMPEEEVDIDSGRECSNGLHVGSRSFGIGSFGDTKVLCLVNPAKVRSVPHHDGEKMRVSEMFIAAALEVNEEGEYMDADVDLVHLDEDYHNYSVEELQDALSGKKFLEIITCQQEQAPVTKVDMEKIKDMLILKVKQVK